MQQTGCLILNTGLKGSMNQSHKSRMWNLSVTFSFSVPRCLCFSLSPSFFLSNSLSATKPTFLHSFPPSQREIRQSEVLLTGSVKYLSCCEERSEQNVFYMFFCGSACVHSGPLSNSMFLHLLFQQFYPHACTSLIKEKDLWGNTSNKKSFYTDKNMV